MFTFDSNDSNSSSDPVIRAAEPRDHADIVAMDRQGRERTVEIRGGVAWTAEHPPVDAILANESGLAGNCTVLVADLLGHAIGFLVAMEHTDSQRGRILVIDRVYVDPQARDIGCGDALLARAIETARERGCGFVEGDALPGDRETKNLYERAGITARRIIVSKNL